MNITDFLGNVFKAFEIPNTVLLINQLFLMRR